MPKPNIFTNYIAVVVGACIGVGPAASLARAEDKPLWEFGAGATVLSFPDYRGSNQTRTYVLPIPYIVYRGDIFKADRDGVRGVFVDSDNVEINASAGASFPVDSADNDARSGMPNLAPTIELGPAVDIVVWRSAIPGTKLTVRLPVRAGITVERSPEYIGWQFSPKLNLDISDIGGLPDWTLGLVVSPIYGDRRFHSYFYSVSAQYATAGRPAYQAKGGFAGTEFLAALWKRYPRVWVGAFVRYDMLAGAVFNDSPLVNSRGYFAAGIAAAWIFGESSQRVHVRD